jgi:hypothetical protein
MYTITELNEKNGIYISKQGEAQLSIDKYSILTYFNTSHIRDQLKQINTLDEQITLISAEATKNKERITELFQELENIEDIADTHKIRKRGLINAVGYVTKFLWGTPNADDDEYYRQNIEKLKGDDTMVQILLKRQIHLINNSVNDNFARNEKILFNNKKELLTQIEEIHHMIQEDANSITIVDKRSKYNRLYKIQLASLGVVDDEITTLQEAILHAKNNILHPTVINLKTLMKTLESVKLKDRRFPHQTSIENIAKYSTIGTLHTEFQAGILLFLFQIPLVELDLYDLYELTPFPFAFSYPSETYYVFLPKTPFILLSQAKTRYASLHDISQCLFHNNQYICSQMSHPIIEPPCEVQFLLRHQTTACNLSAIPSIEEIWHQVDQNTYIFTINQDIEILFTRDAISKKRIPPHRGLLQVNPDVVVTSRSETFRGTRTSTNTTITPHYINFDLPKPLEQYTPVKHRTQFHPKSLNSINTAEIKLLTNDLERQYNEINTAFQLGLKVSPY